MTYGFRKNSKGKSPSCSAQPKAAMIYGSQSILVQLDQRQGDYLRDHTPSLGVELEQLIAPPTSADAFAPIDGSHAVSVRLSDTAESCEDVGGFEEQFRGMFEDQVFLAKVFLKSHVFVTQECWDRYRQHPESCVSIGSKGRKKTFRRNNLFRLVGEVPAV